MRLLCRIRFYVFSNGFAIVRYLLLILKGSLIIRSLESAERCISRYYISCRYPTVLYCLSPFQLSITTTSLQTDQKEPSTWFPSASLCHKSLTLSPIYCLRSSSVATLIPDQDSIGSSRRAEARRSVRPSLDEIALCITIKVTISFPATARRK